MADDPTNLLDPSGLLPKILLADAGCTSVFCNTVSDVTNALSSGVQSLGNSVSQSLQDFANGYSSGDQSVMNSAAGNAGASVRNTVSSALNMVPGASLINSAQANYDAGNYGTAAVLAVGSLIDAGAAVLTGGDSAAAKGITTVEMSTSRFGQAAEHISDAQAAGFPSVLTIDRLGADANRAASTGGLPKIPGMQLDEYPPAMFKEGGAGASVRPINPSDNMSAGAYIGNCCRRLPDGSRVEIKVVP